MTTLVAVLVTTLPSEIIQIVRVCSWSLLYISCPDFKLCLMRVITLLASKFLLQGTWIQSLQVIAQYGAILGQNPCCSLKSSSSPEVPSVTGGISQTTVRRELRKSRNM